jgi:methionyl aminopeptidase
MNKLKALRTANTITEAILCDLKSFILREKVLSTEEVNVRTERLIRYMNMGNDGIEPAFKGYKGFPKSICISINDEVVHGIPSETKLINKGDLVSLDMGIRYKGYCSDMAISFVNSTLSFGKKQKLVEDTKKALDDAIADLNKYYPLCHLSTITAAINKYSDRYGVVHAYGGHEVGEQVHQGNLFVPNSWNNFKKDVILKPGIVFTIEPMLTLGKGDVKIDEDSWTVRTEDGSLAAHFEYSVAITDKGVEVLR